MGWLLRSRSLVLVVLALAPAAACNLFQSPPATATATGADGGEDPEGEGVGGSWDPSPVAADKHVNEPTPMPTECAAAAVPPGADAGADALCVPDESFTKKLCTGPRPDFALALLAKGSPFTRMYMRGDVEAWNSEGRSTPAKLVLDEEVLVLRRRVAAKNSIVVGSNAGYQVMRWDGTCYSIDGGELTARRPGTVKYAPIPWTRLSDRSREALLKVPRILAASEKRAKDCKAVASAPAAVSLGPKPCEAADGALSASIVAEVRGGLAIPTPDPL